MSLIYILEDDKNIQYRQSILPWQHDIEEQ